MHYTIIDVETTGRSNKITEISIFKFDGTHVIEEFTSLVNPEIYIPDHITALTGIDSHMVANAPTFEAISKDILDITKDSIFVAHNVNFDFNVIQKEFKHIGIEFTRKKLCTVRLSRSLLPGHKSYSLGKLCKDLNIDLVGRHRARGDAEATVILFKKLLSKENAEVTFTNFLNKNSKEATLPPNLPKEQFERLPNAAGIYYFKNKKNAIIYVGKAKNVKKRVISHFYSKAQKSLDMCRETGGLDFQLSGSEVIALLMEDAEIKKHFPKYNTVSKKRITGQGLFSYQDRNGLIHLALNDLKTTPNAILKFYNKLDARQTLERICKTYNLCPKFCHLQENVSECSHFLINCNGVCKGQESIENYNERVSNAICEIINKNENKLLKTDGRTSNEMGFVYIKNGMYLGYGFIPKNEQITHEDTLDFYLTRQKDNSDVQKILRSYLHKTNQ
jgi:DNA polymerase-3 subunit epsilon